MNKGKLASSVVWFAVWCNTHHIVKLSTMQTWTPRKDNLIYINKCFIHFARIIITIIIILIILWSNKQKHVFQKKRRMKKEERTVMHVQQFFLQKISNKRCIEDHVYLLDLLSLWIRYWLELKVWNNWMIAPQNYASAATTVGFLSKLIASVRLERQ